MDITISVIGEDGKVRWLRRGVAMQMVGQGRMKLFPNPKRNYYPEYDQTIKSDPVNVPQSEDGVIINVDILEVDVL